MYRDTILVDIQKCKYYYEMEHFAFVLLCMSIATDFHVSAQ